MLCELGNQVKIVEGRYCRAASEQARGVVFTFEDGVGRACTAGLLGMRLIDFCTDKNVKSSRAAPTIAGSRARDRSCQN